MQAGDFPEGYPASAFVVYQISAQVGRGFAARFEFPDAPQLTMLGETIAEGQSGGGTSNFPANTVMAQRYDGVSGQVLSASAYLGSSASGNMRMGLYADNAGELGALIATTEAKAFSATGSGHWEAFTLDDASEVWDLIPMMEFLIENTTDPNRISFLVTGVYKFRVGVRRSGSTDTITSADLSLRKDGVNA